MQRSEIELLEEINPNENIEEILSDEETDAMTWDEDAKDDHLSDDDTYEYEVS